MPKIVVDIRPEIDGLVNVVLDRHKHQLLRKGSKKKFLKPDAAHLLMLYGLKNCPAIDLRSDEVELIDEILGEAKEVEVKKAIPKKDTK